MLRRLFIKNYALIEQSEIVFNPGLNILTGETGAGKSILLGAIGLILGKRADAAVIIDPSGKCVVEAEFDIAGHTTLFDDPTFAELEPPSDNVLLIRRELTPAGKSRAFINDSPVTLPILQELTRRVIDVHGQHQAPLLNEPDTQRNLLDRYGNIQTTDFAASLAQLKQLDKACQDLKAQESDAIRQLDFYRYQWQELHDAGLSVTEDESIEAELRLLENAEHISTVLQETQHRLNDDEKLAILPALNTLIRKMEKLSGLMPAVQVVIARLNDARYAVDDAATELAALADNIEADPRRLAQLTERQNVYNKLKIKYNVRTASELLAILADLNEKVNGFESIGERIANLEKQIKTHAANLAQHAKTIEQARIQAAGVLSQKINSTLKAVGLVHAGFEIAVTRSPETAQGLIPLDGYRYQAAPHGINAVTFKIRTNKGQPLETLAKIASGGEISRVMLAIKAALAEKMQLSALIFDEIDTGISGEVAFKVGRVMEQLATHHQLLVITHLPQIASRGQTHFHIYKEIVGEKTFSRIRQLTDAERVEELARIMGGDSPTDALRQSAKELLNA